MMPRSYDVSSSSATPSQRSSRRGHLALGVALLVDLVEKLRACLLGLDLRLGLLVEVQILLPERVTPGVHPHLEAGPVGTDAAALSRRSRGGALTVEVTTVQLGRGPCEQSWALLGWWAWGRAEQVSGWLGS